MQPLLAKLQVLLLVAISLVATVASGITATSGTTVASGITAAAVTLGINSVEVSWQHLYEATSLAGVTLASTEGSAISTGVTSVLASVAIAVGSIAVGSIAVKSDAELAAVSTLSESIPSESTPVESTPRAVGSMAVTPEVPSVEVASGETKTSGVSKKHLAKHCLLHLVQYILLTGLKTPMGLTTMDFDCQIVQSPDVAG